MDSWIQTAVTIFASVIASGGFWGWIQKRGERTDVRTQLVLGLAHDRIVCLAMQYIDREWISKEEYDSLHKYLYTPYQKLGGNGTAERLMSEVSKLRMKPLMFKEETK